MVVNDFEHLLNDCAILKAVDIMKIAIIGAGAMGGSLAEGLLGSGRFAPNDITVADPSAARLEPLAARGATVTANNVEAAAGADVVMVVVKPWVVEKVLRQIAPALGGDGRMLVVVAAGVSGADVKAWACECPGGAPATFLAIPNIAAARRCSMTFVVPVDATEGQTAAVRSVFDAVGQTIVTEERLLAAGTTLASCGIAYAMRYVRAAAEGGVELGFRADEATGIVLQTVRGAVELLQAGGEHPEAAIDRVTTPGGVTIRGLNEMEHAGFTSAVIRGLMAGLKAKS